MASRFPLCSCWSLNLKIPSLISPPIPIQIQIPIPIPIPTPSGVCKGNGGIISSGVHHRPATTMIGGIRKRRAPFPCRARRNSGDSPDAQQARDERRALQAALWAAEAAYILWLFLLPYAPGDPVWAIKSETINDLVGLSLNFFFILPLLNSVGIHLIEAPVLHPMSEGLFNFVIAWTFMFAPLLFTDNRRDRYKGSLDLLWGFQMFLTNTFLIPYMAIRLDDTDVERPLNPTPLASLMTRGATLVGLVGGAACFISILWAFFGRIDGGFGGISDRYDYLLRYLESERLAYAFIWDIGLYTIFQPWLIGDNLVNVKKSNTGAVSNLRFIPVVGLVAYLLSLDDGKEP